MPEDSFIARLFLMGGGALALLGLILWWVLPLRLPLPPFLLTSLLAVTYGLACQKKGPKIGEKKKPKPDSKA